MFGRNLESACVSRQVTKFNRLENAADNLAAEAAKHPAGSPEWRAVMKNFVEVCRVAAANGTPVTK